MDIQAGDVVVCVALHEPDPFLRMGKTYRVIEVCDVVGECCDCTVGIEVEGIPGEKDSAYCASLFSKIHPADEEFTSQISALKPVREDA